MEINKKPLECSLKTITPIHIGSGGDYGTSEFITGEIGKTKVIKRIKIDEYFLSLPKPERKILLEKLTKRFFLDSEKPISTNFNRYISRLKCSKPNKEISETIKTLDKIYIPGSSIKGAIKTALFYCNVDEEFIINLKESGKIYTYFDKKGKEKATIDDNDYKNILNSFFANASENLSRYNILRFLKISDTSSYKNPSIYSSSTLKAIQIAHQRYKEPKYDIHRGSNRFLETIEEGILLKFKIYPDYNKEFYDNSESKVQLGISDKEEIIDMNNIKKSLYTFSRDYIQHEYKFAKEYEIEGLAEKYLYLHKHNTEKQPLIRIGSGSGFLGNTIALKIKKFSEETGDNFYDLIKKTAHKHGEIFPKSRKFIKSEKNKYIPLGWVRIIKLGD